MSQRVPATHRYALERVGARSVVLDIGAGSGAFTLAAAARGAAVIALEPRRVAADYLTSMTNAADVQVLVQAVAADPSSALRYVARPGVRRLAATEADDGENAALVSLTELVARYQPTVVRFRAPGQEAALAAIDDSALTLIVDVDTLLADTLTRPYVVAIDDELALASTPLPHSRQHLIVNGARSETRPVSASDLVVLANREASAREPMRRVRLARWIEAQPKPLHGELIAVADRLRLDPADEVADAMAWHALPDKRSARRLRAFNELLDQLQSPTISGGERPSALSLPR